MTAREIISLLGPSERVRLIKEGKPLYTGYKALLGHADITEEIMDAEVKRFRAVPEIRHREWEKRGLTEPLQPQEMPEYAFSDSQMSIYYKIEI